MKTQPIFFVLSILAGLATAVPFAAPVASPGADGGEPDVAMRSANPSSTRKAEFGPERVKRQGPPQITYGTTAEVFLTKTAADGGALNRAVEIRGYIRLDDDEKNIKKDFLESSTYEDNDGLGTEVESFYKETPFGPAKIEIKVFEDDDFFLGGNEGIVQFTRNFNTDENRELVDGNWHVHYFSKNNFEGHIRFKVEWWL